MSFHNPTSLILLKRSKLVFYSKRFISGLDLNFSENSICNLEIINKEKLREQIELFLSENKIEAASAGIILSDDLLFFKETSIDLEQQKNDLKIFLEEVPFEAEDLAYQLKLDKKNTTLIATNQELFLSIKNILESKAWHVDLVVANTNEMDFKNGWQNVLKQMSDLLDYNFLFNKNQIIETTETTNVEKNKSKFLLLISAAVFLIVLTLALVVYLKYK